MVGYRASAAGVKRKAIPLSGWVNNLSFVTRKWVYFKAHVADTLRLLLVLVPIATALWLTQLFQSNMVFPAVDWIIYKSLIISDATVWKFENRFGFRFCSSRNRGFGFSFQICNKKKKKFLGWKLKPRFWSVSVFALCSCSSFHTAHCIVPLVFRFKTDDGITTNNTYCI